MSGTNPLFSANKLKLGIFATNVSNGCTITTVLEAYEPNWPNALSIAEIANRHGWNKDVMPRLAQAGLRRAAL